MIAAVTLGRHREGLHISASALRTLHDCPREWFYRYVEGAPREHVPAGMVLGKAIHKALAFFYRCLRDGDGAAFDDIVPIAASSILSAVASTPRVQFRHGEDASTLVELASRLLEAFINDGYRPARVIAVEQPFSLPVVHPETGELTAYEERIVGAIDLIAEDGGHVVVVDHKTASRADKEKAKRPDLQMALYSIAAKEMLGVERVDLRYQNVIKTKSAKVDVQDIQRTEHDEAEAIEAVTSGLELIHVAVAHPEGKRLMGRRRSWRCKECSYRRRCGEDRS